MHDWRASRAEPGPRAARLARLLGAGDRVGEALARRLRLPTASLHTARGLLRRWLSRGSSARLHASEARFRALVDHAADAFFVLDFENGTIVDVNRSASDSLGYTRAELIGMHPREFDVGLDEAALARLLEQVRAGETVTFETRHRRKDGTVFPVEIRGRQYEQGDQRFRLALVRDITERKRAEADLRAGEERFRVLSEASLAGVYLIQDDRFVYVNPALAQMFGYTVDELTVRVRPEQLIHPDDRQIVVGNVSGPLGAATDAARHEFRGVRKDGSVFPVEVHGRRVAHGGTIGVLGTLIDVTERHSHGRFLEGLDRVNQAMQGTRDLDRVMTDVLAVVLEVFACDRAWLAHPCDSRAATWRVAMERTRPEFPGPFAPGTDLPMTPDVARVFEAATRSGGSLRFDPASEDGVPRRLADRFAFQSMLVMAVSPKVGQPYLFGLNQCSHPRVWTPPEERFFQEIGRRFADALTSVAFFRSLSDSERMLDEAQRMARIGYWDRDLVAHRVTLSAETCRIFGLPLEERVLDLEAWQATWRAFIHPEDRPGVVAAMTAALAGGPPYDVEFRIVRRDGEVRVVHSQGSVRRDASGRPVRMFGTQQDITERKRAEAQLRASEERFRAVVQFSFDVYWETDAEHRFTVQQFGEGVADAPAAGSEIGKTRWELPYLEPDDDAWRRHRATLDAHLPFRDFELARPTPDGGRRYVSVSGLPVFDAAGRFLGYRGVGRHITDRKRAEQRLVAQHNVARILADATTIEEATPRILSAVCEGLVWEVGVWWRPDRKARVLRCLDVWQRPTLAVPEFVAVCRDIAFRSGDGLPGQVWSSHVPIAIRDVAKEAGMRRGPAAARAGLHGAVAVPIVLAGEVLGVLEFFGRDVFDHGEDLLRTLSAIGSQVGQFIERKRAERDLDAAQANLVHVTRVTTLGELAASIAHEVNQPLAAMVADANASLNWLARPDPDLDVVRESLGAIVADGHRAAEVIRRIRELAKKGAGLEKVPLDVNDLVRDVLPLVRGEVSRHGVSVRLELSPGVPPVVGDRVQLQQVLINLVINGMEAMASVEDRPRELVIRCAADHGEQRVLVTVEDAGVGIGAEAADSLFTTFFTTKPDGMGMGLSISRSIVEAHGGRIWATANPTHGASVHVALPAMR